MSYYRVFGLDLSKEDPSVCKACKIDRSKSYYRFQAESMEEAKQKTRELPAHFHPDLDTLQLYL